MYRDAALDGSGFSPEALRRLLDLAARLPFAEAVKVAAGFGLWVSASELERLSRRYAERCRAAVAEQLSDDESLEQSDASDRQGRIMVLQTDGVYVLAQPDQGVCPGIEIKSVVLYPQSAPSDRWMLADVVSADTLLPHVAGLLQHASVTPEDTLIGLGDGAAWVENLFDHLGAIRITDVYHACEYLEVVMQALAWDEHTRAQHRREWYQGKVSARAWLERYLPDPEVWMGWNETARNALAYLE